MPTNITHPWFKFWPSKWLGDSGLRASSIAARGLWIDVRAIMHANGVPHGHLAFEGGVPLPLEKLAQIAGTSADEVERLLKELEANHVFARTEAGVIYDADLIREHKVSTTNRQNGSKGGAATWSVGRRGQSVTDNPTDPAKANAIANSLISPLPSSSEESTEEEKEPSVDEVIAAGKAEGIPESYCREYHENKCIMRGWFARNGQLIDWRRQLGSWWRKYGKDPKATRAEIESEIDDLRAEMTWQTDERRRDEIRARLRQLKP